MFSSQTEVNYIVLKILIIFMIKTRFTKTKSLMHIICQIICTAVFGANAIFLFVSLILYYQYNQF